MSLTDLHIVKTELFDADMMVKILRDDSFSKIDLSRLKAYKKHRISSNQIQVVYHYSNGCQEEQLGRLYAKNNIGIQSFPREIRNPLIEKYD